MEECDKDYENAQSMGEVDLLVLCMFEYII